MIGKIVVCQFRNSYGNPNGGVYLCEILDSIVCVYNVNNKNRSGSGDNRGYCETHYLVKTIDEAPSRIMVVHYSDLLEIRS